MNIRIPNNIFEGLVRWMVRGPWPEHLQQAIHNHTGFYCEHHDIDSFEELSDRIGGHWVSVLNDMAFNDFLGQETEDGNVVTAYLKSRGWKETKIARAYLEGIRDSVVSLYEVSDIVPGESFLARDLLLDGEPFRVLERSATKTMAQWEQFAMRIVNVRGQNIIAGGILPLKPDLADDLLSEFSEMVEGFEEIIAEAGDEGDFGKVIPPDGIQNIALGIALNSASPFFATTWMAATPLHPDEQMMQQHYQGILDRPIGLLDDKTPRESMRTAKGRRKVVAWLKFLELNEAKEKAGTNAPIYDFTWMWQELGVADLRK